MSGLGVSRARAQSLEPAVLLDELEASVALLVTSVNEGPARVRWAARLKAFRELRVLVKNQETQLKAAREAMSLKEELADV